MFQQSGQQTKDNMTDFIFCVEVKAYQPLLEEFTEPSSQDSEEWHKENLARHPSHYASLARWLNMMRLHHFKSLQVSWSSKDHSDTEILRGQTILQYTCAVGRREN